jgi:hypothetical protein
MPYANPQHKKEWASAHKEEAAASSRRYYEENRTAILESRDCKVQAGLQRWLLLLWWNKETPA